MANFVNFTETWQTVSSTKPEHFRSSPLEIMLRAACWRRGTLEQKQRIRALHVALAHAAWRHWKGRSPSRDGRRRRPLVAEASPARLRQRPLGRCPPPASGCRSRASARGGVRPLTRRDACLGAEAGPARHPSAHLCWRNLRKRLWRRHRFWMPKQSQRYTLLRSPWIWHDPLAASSSS